MMQSPAVRNERGQSPLPRWFKVARRNPGSGANSENWASG
jgi:hypothetical protein